MNRATKCRTFMFGNVRYFKNTEMFDVRKFTDFQMFDVRIFADFQMFECSDVRSFSDVRCSNAPLCSIDRLFPNVRTLKILLLLICSKVRMFANVRFFESSNDSMFANVRINHCRLSFHHYEK